MPEERSDSARIPTAFSADPVAVYEFVGQFFESLVVAGVEHVCLSPGSRSTPLAIAADRTSGLQTWTGLDERASSFFALGLAKATRRTVAILCTSGTAAANFLPAVVEAACSRVPLLVLTADRPPELRDWGAGQTIDQPGLYGRYPRWSAEVPMPSRGDDGLRYVGCLAARAVDEAQGPRPGPVHLNWPFREPLAPPWPISGERANSAASRTARTTPKFSAAARVARDQDVDELVSLVNDNERGVICCGPMDVDPTWVSALLGFSEVAGWPILAGPASQLRGARSQDAAAVLSMADGFLRAPGFATQFRPGVVLRLGETPVSKVQRLWIESSSPGHVWWLDEGSSWGEPSHRVTRVVRSGSGSLLGKAAQRLRGRDRGGESRKGAWKRAFEVAEIEARRVFEAFVSDPENFSGLTVAASASRCVGRGDSLFVSNSMSVRLLDLAHDGSQGAVRVLCNRGASGIDGITSTALGVAAAGGGRTLLLTGDLALLHDLSGLLLAKRESIDLLIVVLDDDGGGIFSFLPIAEQGETVEFERLFGTPHGLDLSRLAAFFELGYSRVSSMAELDDALAEGLRRGGVHLVHVPLDRKRNELHLRSLLARIVERVDAGITS